MANTTPNYNLIKPLGTEKYDVAVPNANMDNIDLQLKNLEDTKVDVEVGKGLSEENYTLIEKNKVANLPDDTNAQLAETDQRIDSIVTTPVPVGEIIAEEIIDARQGEVSVGANITEVKSQLAQNTSITEGGITSKPLKKGILSFTFDNSFLEIYTKVFPQFKSRNIKFAVSPVAEGFTGTQKNGIYYNYDNLKEMVASGMEIIAHGMDGLVLGANTTPLSQAEYEILEAKKFWNKLGFKVNGYCGTSSAVHDDYQPFLKAGYDYAFSKYWSESSIADSVVSEATDIYKMGRHSIYTTMQEGGLQAIYAEIDYIATNKKWLNYYNHQIDTGLSDSITLVDMNAILDYALSKDIEILLPTEAINKLNTKLIAGENIKKLREEMIDFIPTTKENLLLNARYNGGTTLPTNWGNRDTTVGGLTKSLLVYNGHNAIKYAFTSLNNVGNYVGLSQVTPLSPRNKGDVLTFSIEVESDTSACDLTVSMSLQNASGVSINNIIKTVQLSAGRKSYEFSLLIPKTGYAQLAFNLNFYPKSAIAMNIIHSKPKLEYSAIRTPWIPDVEAIPVPSTALIFQTISDNNPTPDVTNSNYILVGNTAATTITNFVTTHSAQEITLFFSTANTTIVGSGLIRLKDGLDFVATLGDVLTLIKNNNLSGAWYEKSRTDRVV